MINRIKDLAVNLWKQCSKQGSPIKECSLDLSTLQPAGLFQVLLAAWIFAASYPLAADVTSAGSATLIEYRVEHRVEHRVRSAFVESGSYQKRICFTGKLKMRQELDVISTFDGRIVEVYVKPGEYVTAGSALCRVDREATGYSYRDHIYRSRCSGVLLKVDAKPLQWVAGGASLCRVGVMPLKNHRVKRLEETSIDQSLDGDKKEDVSLDPSIETPWSDLDAFYAEVFASGRALSEIEEGQRAEITLYGGDTLYGFVESCHAQVDRSSMTLPLNIALKARGTHSSGRFDHSSFAGKELHEGKLPEGSREEKLISGAPVEGEIFLQPQQSLKIDEAALIYIDGRAQIFAIEEGRAILHPVVIEYIDGKYLWTRSLQAGMEVVVEGHQKLHAGDRVCILNHQGFSDDAQQGLEDHGG